MYCQCNTKKHHMQQTTSGDTYTVCSKRNGGCGKEYKITEITRAYDSNIDVSLTPTMMGLGQQIQHHTRNISLGGSPMPSNQQIVSPNYMHMPTKRSSSTIRKMPGYGFNWEHHCGYCGFTGKHVDAFTYCPQCGDEF